MIDTYDCATIIRMNKLTLSVDPGVVRAAKRYADARGTSLSRLVETMLQLVAGSAPGDGRAKRAAPPVLARLRGSLKRGTVADYHRHLERKYR
jgi:hypothetical protein